MLELLPLSRGSRLFGVVRCRAAGVAKGELRLRGTRQQLGRNRMPSHDNGRDLRPTDAQASDPFHATKSRHVKGRLRARQQDRETLPPEPEVHCE